MNKPIISLICILFFLMSCASMPTPKTQEETLLAIPLEFSKEPGLSFFGNYIIAINDYQNQSREVKRVKIRNGSGTQVLVEGLPPGKYYISGYYYQYESAGNISDYDATFKSDFCPFELEPGTLTIAPRGFSIKAYKKNASSNITYMGFDVLKQSTSILRKHVLDSLKKDSPEELAQWRIMD